MATELNLARDVKLFVSETDLTTQFSPSNTFEVRILDGYDFGQDTESEDITVSEAGTTPARGKKTFNTALNPADISFSTYIRPYMSGSDHNAIEKPLWEALVGNDSFFTNAVSSGTDLTIDFNESNVNELKKLFLFVEFGSGADKERFKIREAVVNEATLNFGIDAIGQIDWTLQGSKMEPIDQGEMPSTFTAAPNFAKFVKNKLTTMTLSGSFDRAPASVTLGTTGTFVLSDDPGLTTAGGPYDLLVTIDQGVQQTISYTPSVDNLNIEQVSEEVSVLIGGGKMVADATNNNVIFESLNFGTDSFITVDNGATNDLLAALDTGLTTDFATDSDLGSEQQGSESSRNYTIPITGGSFTITNNITYLVPEELGVVNEPIGHFTGGRDMSGSVTAYLRSGSGSNGTAQLIADLLNNTDEITTSFDLDMFLGGQGNTPNVQLDIPTAHLSIPTRDTEDVMSTTINFSALPTGLDQTDEMTIVYTAS